MTWPFKELKKELAPLFLDRDYGEKIGSLIIVVSIFPQESKSKYPEGVTHQWSQKTVRVDVFVDLCIYSQLSMLIFTKAWREFIPYKNSNALITTANATKDVIENAARQIYKAYPEILKALKL